ncbi:LON peptidase substrate-binding domain-containing protein [Candidatus Sumerlaeota bacterium]|nr:LON peptidase substrate-binding domain-containing protein [Candidatus Sumerlaeota bacterium]
MEIQTWQVPIFPLPGIVFFPNSILRLHVFEPRYREMTRDCIEGDGLMVVSLLKPGWENAYYESPAVYRVAGLGRVVDYKKFPSGKYDITLNGLERVRIENEYQHSPYRMAEVSRLNGFLSSPEEIGHAIQRQFQCLSRAMERLLELLPQMRPIQQKILASHPHPGVVADLLAHYFVTESYDKQCILEEQNVLRRIGLVQIQIERFIEQQLHKHYRDRL